MPIHTWSAHATRPWLGVEHGGRLDLGTVVQYAELYCTWVLYPNGYYIYWHAEHLIGQLLFGFLAMCPCTQAVLIVLVVYLCAGKVTFYLFIFVRRVS